MTEEQTAPTNRSVTERSDSIGKLALALSKAQCQMKRAKKDSANDFLKTKYADLSACIEAASPALNANDLAVTQIVGTIGVHTVIETWLLHGSGEWMKGTLALRPKDHSPQSVGGAISYGRRYAYKAMVGLADEDDDGNSNRFTNQTRR